MTKISNEEMSQAQELLKKDLKKGNLEVKSLTDLTDGKVVTNRDKDRLEQNITELKSSGTDGIICTVNCPNGWIMFGQKKLYNDTVVFHSEAIARTHLKMMCNGKPAFLPLNSNAHAIANKLS